MADSAVINAYGVEDAQNACNKFFARQIHKLKKMLRPLFSRKPTPAPVVSDEELDNSLNEALEARLAKDLSEEDVHAMEQGRITLIVVNPASTVSVPQMFESTRFSWTFLPSPDYDICPEGDYNALSSCQTPEQQSPPSSPS